MISRLAQFLNEVNGCGVINPIQTINPKAITVVLSLTRILNTLKSNKVDFIAIMSCFISAYGLDLKQDIIMQ